MLKSDKKSSGKWLLLWSICMGIAHVTNAQITINNDNYSSGVHNYCSSGYIIASNASPYTAIYSGSADVTYTAPNYILLKPGFKVSSLTSAGKFMSSFGVCGIAVTNTSTTCTYSVTVSVQETNGSINNALPSQAFTLSPGSTHVYSFTAQSGYWVKLSTLQFVTQTGSCATNTFGVTSSTGPGNCFSCSNPTQITQWVNTSSSSNTSFEITNQLIVGRFVALKETNVTTGIGENENGQPVTIEVAPNPANGIFVLTVSNEPKGTVKDVIVYDVRGRIVFERRNSPLQTLTIDVTNHPKGIYFLRVLEEGHQWQKKLINE